MDVMETTATPDAVWRFWFEELTEKDWFKSTPELDRTIYSRFAMTHLALARGIDPVWHQSPQARLAAIIVLDQFPRNIYRGSPLAFATDPIALSQAKLAIEAGVEAELSQNERAFLYLPFEHSEDLAEQHRCVALFTELGHDNYLDFAVRHREVIVRFNRFPHRNPILGRASSDEELHYLAQPGAGF